MGSHSPGQTRYTNRLKRGRRKPLPREAKQQLLEACKDDLDRLIVIVLLQTGLRVSEFCRVRSDSINWRTGFIHVTGKGSYDREVWMPALTKRTLSEWLQRHDRVPLGPRGVQVRLRKIAERSKITQKVCPHVLRHTFAVDAVRKGVSVRALQLALGHEDLNTTAIYLNMTAMDMADEFRQAERSPGVPGTLGRVGSEDLGGDLL